MESEIKYGLILLGNSGVGKSFLANRLLNDDQAFESRFSVRSVTRHTEWKDMSAAIGNHTYSVANIPGLVEANQKLIDENRQEIMNAFEQHPCAIVLFVFGNNNGRIRDEDLVAFMRINGAYEFLPNSMILIINGIPSNRPSDYDKKTTKLLQELTHIETTHIYFIEEATSETSKNKIHNLLRDAIAECEPNVHKKKHDIKLLADEISRLKKESKYRQDQLLAQQTEDETEENFNSTLDSNSNLGQPLSQPTEYVTQEKLNLNSDSTLDLDEPSSQQRFTSTSKSEFDIIDSDELFNETMKNLNAEYNLTMEELKKSEQNRNTDAIKQLTDHIKMQQDLRKELRNQMSSRRQVTEKHSDSFYQTMKRKLFEFSNTFWHSKPHGEHQSCQPSHPKNLHHDNNEDNFDSSSSRPSNSHHKNPTSN
ncbi:unnamed protein product [Adineta steineri]|uniref:AIG1-type G domain-containing protein n=1 Tax=Adineta steineri TaxID=433720 RepID=A0A816AJK9_9BILA|nr:unnamed protein product [Adineta steineri]CAF1596611.1 unnamed protein product [Adineta steineri]